MNFKKIINSLSYKQIRLARAVEKAGLASYSKACKAIFENDPIVNFWIEQLKKTKNN